MCISHRYKQYLPNKPHSWGIKAFVLADSISGYLYRFKLYLGSETDLVATPGYNKTEQTVLTLMDGLFGRGHHVFTDRYYTSVPLLEKLASEHTSMTGTIAKNRRFLPPAIKGLKMKKGEIKAYQKDSNVCLVWRDKR